MLCNHRDSVKSDYSESQQLFDETTDAAGKILSRSEIEAVLRQEGCFFGRYSLGYVYCFGIYSPD
jgi:hypothetical protein